MEKNSKLLLTGQFPLLSFRAMSNKAKTISSAPLRGAKEFAGKTCCLMCAHNGGACSGMAL